MITNIVTAKPNSSPNALDVAFQGRRDNIVRPRPDVGSLSWFGSVIFAATTLLVATIPSIVEAADFSSPNPPEHPCDYWAADPDDPNKVRTGFSFGDLNKSRARGHCEDAVRQFPDVPRFAYQLGRAYSALDRDGEAFELTERAAKQGYLPAMLSLGRMHISGTGVTSNLDIGLRYMRQAADSGLVKAQRALGELFAIGVIVPRDEQKAFFWFRKAAEGGDVFAHGRVGIAYLYGVGTDQDYQEAARWNKLGAEAGDSTAQTSLAIQYQHGVGVEKDLSLAAKWFGEASSRGDPAGIVRLGRMHENGEFFPQNYERAAEFYERSVFLGSSSGNYHLGRLYENGWGVPGNLDRALELYEEAARGGDERARTRLIDLRNLSVCPESS